MAKKQGTKLPAGGKQSGAAAKPSGAVALLKQDHREVEKLFKKYEEAGSPQEKQELVKQICMQLIVHTTLEEEIFYPACRAEGSQNAALDEAQVEHDTTKILIAELMSHSPEDEFYDAKVTVLSEYVKHHVGEEEQADDGMFAKAKSAKVDMNALGQRLQARKRELLAQVEANRLGIPRPRALDVSLSAGNRNQLQEYQTMERYSSRYRDEDRGRGSRSDEQERDEFGRFVSDDERGGGRGRGAMSRGGGRSGGGGFRERDEEGRFMSEDERGGGGGRGGMSRGGGEGRGGEGRGGWFGDQQGPSEASRRGWDEREDDRGGGGRGGRGGGGFRERDEEGRFMSEDERGGGGGRGGMSRGGGNEGRGWYGDSEGHSQAPRRGWDEREEERGGGSRGSRGSGRSSGGGGRGEGRGEGRGHGEGGWFGDSEGHADAARRGWEEREGGGGSRARGGGGGSRYEERGGGGRSSRGSEGRGHGEGGWFGDSEGHAEAARRGWEERGSSRSSRGRDDDDDRRGSRSGGR